MERGHELTVDARAARKARRIHDLRRLRWPFTRRMLFPLNVGVMDGMLVELARLFETAGARFWLRDGTALGVYRDGTVLPYDDDADLGVWDKDLPRLLPLFVEMTHRGYVLYRRSETVFAFLKGGETIEFCVSGRPGAEPYVSRLEFFFKDLRPIEYRDGRFWIPRDTDAYLEYSYGVDWRTPKIGAWLNTCWQSEAKRTSHANAFRPRVHTSTPAD